MLVRSVRIADSFQRGQKVACFIEDSFMSDSIHFSAIEATGQEKATCPLCTENSIDLEFEFSSEARPKEELRGRCCIACAAALLDAMRSLAIADQGNAR